MAQTPSFFPDLFADTSNDEVDRDNRYWNPYLVRLTNFGPESIGSGGLSHVSLFCGGGGLDLGIGFSGFRTMLAHDIAPSFVDSVTSNIHGTVGLVKDALCVSRDDVVGTIGRNEVDLVSAGPPCQAFSILGMRGALEDPRGKLALKYLELVSEIRPSSPSEKHRWWVTGV